MKTRTGFVALTLLSVTASGWTYDAFQDKLQRPAAGKQDVEKLTRPPSESLKSSDIKDFRDQLNLVQGQVFRDGALPKGSTLQADMKTADTFRVRTPFNQLSESAQTQVLSKMPEAKSVATPLLLSVALVNGATRVETVSVAPSSRKPAAVVVAAPSAPGRVSVVPEARPARLAAPTSPRVSGSSEKKSETAPSTQPRMLPVAAKESPRGDSHMSLPEASRLFVGKETQSVLVLDNPIRPSKQMVTQVFLPSSGKDTVVVTHVQVDPAGLGIKVTISAPGNAMPGKIVERLTEDNPEAMPLLSAENNISLDVMLKPDGTFSIVGARRTETPMNMQENMAGQPSDVRSALTDISNAAAPTQPAVSNVGFLKASQQLAAAVGFSPTAVILEVANADPSSVAIESLAIVNHNNGNAVLVQPLKTQSGAVAYSLQGRLANFSNTLQAEVQSRLESSGGPGFVVGNPELVIESSVDSEKGFEVLSVALARTEQSKMPVVLWKAEPLRVQKSESVEAPAALPARLIGVAPASLTLIKTVFGESAGNSSFQNTQPLSVRFVSPAKTSLIVRWMPTGSVERQSFVFVGKPIEFTDAIREEINARLAEEPAAKGKKPVESDIQVEFLVDQTKPVPTVEVVDVGPSPRELAQRQAEKMGLSANDYLLIDIGARFLIVIDRGQTISLVGKKGPVRLRSVDGNLIVVANPRQAPKDSSVLLLASRLTIKNNWANLVRLAGENIDDVVDKTLRENPKSEQFLIRIGSIESDHFVIRPLDPLSATLAHAGASKPGSR